MRAGPNFLRGLSQKELISTIRTDLQNPFDLCCIFLFLFTSIFLRRHNLHIYLSWSEFDILYLFIFIFFLTPTSWQAAVEWSALCRAVPCRAAHDIGRWEKCWGSTLIWRCGHKFCFLLLSLTHCHPPAPAPRPSFHQFLHAHSFIYLFSLNSVLSCSDGTQKMWDVLISKEAVKNSHHNALSKIKKQKECNINSSRKWQHLLDMKSHCGMRINYIGFYYVPCLQC